MLSKRNACSRIFATITKPHNIGVIIPAIAALISFVVSAVQAQMPGLLQSAEIALFAGATDDADLPDASDVVSAYMKLREWTDNFSLPSADDPDAQMTLQGARGICVILRRSGRILGTGIDNTGDNLMLRRAAGRAFGEAHGDRVVANLPDELKADLGSKLILELEVAGKPIPLLGRTFPELSRQLEPGLDGIAVRRAYNWALQFPCQMRSANLQARTQYQILPLAAQLNLPVQTPAQLVAMSDVSLYRFRSIHLAQQLPSAHPFITFRGDELVPLSSVTEQGIADFADGIATHLLRSFSTHESAKGIKGDYLPHIDEYKILIAPPLDQALAAFALSKYSQSPGVNQSLAIEAAQASKQLLRNLGAMNEGYDNPLASPASAAAIIYAALEPAQVDNDPSVQQLLAAAINLVVKSFNPKNGFRYVSNTGAQVQLNPAARALVAGALGRLLNHGYKNQQLNDTFVRLALDTAWESVPENQQVAMLPWLGWGEDDFAQATGERSLAVINHLKSLRHFLNNSVITAQDQSSSLDQHGGFELGRIKASAQGLRPASYLASMLSDPDLTPPDSVESTLQNHLETMRFAMQLAIRDKSKWSLQDPSKAVGGIRNSLSDIIQTVPAQALGLLTASETLNSLKNLPQSQKKH